MRRRSRPVLGLAGAMAVAVVAAGCGGAAKTALPPTSTLVAPHPAVTSGSPSGGQHDPAQAATTSTAAPAPPPGTVPAGAGPTASTSAGPGAGAPKSGASPRQGATTTTLPALALGAPQDQDGANWVVPQGWTPRSGVQTDGTDHATFVYDSPSDPGATLLIVVTNCGGCVTSDTPAERSQSAATPAGAVTNVHQVNRSRATFTMTTEAPVWEGIASASLPSGDVTDGVVADNDSLHNDPPTNQQAASYVVAVVTLPTARHADATRILNAVYIG